MRSPLLLSFLICCTLCGTGCQLFASGPAETARHALSLIEDGRIEEATRYYSTRVISANGITALKSTLSTVPSQFKREGGIKQLEVEREDTIGEVAEVTFKVVYGSDLIEHITYKFVREDGDWKIDGAIAIDAQGTNRRYDAAPRHPERAVADVVAWARGERASQLAEWVRRHPAPPVCAPTAADETRLPDAIKYHLVDDGEARDRLTAELLPVLRLVGCRDARGIVGYKGATIGAVSLPSGQLAVSPDSMYFSPYPPDERIFHTLAKLRLFLARAAFRQMLPAEEPTDALTTGDMELRRELKSDYLAAVASLTLDRKPEMLDGAALDLNLYGDEGNSGGVDSRPSLQQIKDLFGAVRQDWSR